MSTMTDHPSSGIRDPYRSLLILLGGALMALAALAGQTGYRDELISPVEEVPAIHSSADLHASA